MAGVSHASAAAPKSCPTCGNRYPADALFCPNDGTPLVRYSPNGVAGSGGLPVGPDVSPIDPYLGQEISGHIQIQQLVGIGAMGRVYRAFQRGIDRDVAVKILHRELSANQQLVARFNREAKVASKLQHPNVVQVHLAGQLPDGALYIVMEFLDGLSLLSALSGVGGSMPLQRALHLGLQICDASGEAHAQGVVHRDLKPENVMLVKRGEEPDFVKVLDFGIARLNWSDQSMATAAGLIFGTARYISPEGAQGEQVGPEGDVYAIATLIYQMLAGRTPFEGEQAVGLLIQQIHDAPPQLRSIARAGYVPERIATAIMKNLAKRPEERDVDARAFGRALIDAARASGLSPEDFGARGMLQGRGSNPMQLAPMQRTRQLTLDPELAERLGGGARAATPAPDAPLGDAGSSATRQALSLGTPGAATTKWTPSAELQEKLAAGVSSPAGPGTGFPAPVRQPLPPRTSPATQGAQTAPSRQPSQPGRLSSNAGHVSSTPPPPSAAELASTVAVAPLVQLPLQSPVPSPSPPNARRAPAVDVTLDDGDLVAIPAYYAHPTGTPSPAPITNDGSGPRVAHRPITRSGSDAGTFEGDADEGDGYGLPSKGRSSRAVLFVVVCFLLGVAGATGMAYKFGRIGTSTTTQASLEDAVTRASDALRYHRFDAPAGDNVRDLTDDALRRFPNDPRLLEIRTHAANDLVTVAIELRQAGDAADAIKSLKLALELHPEEHSAKTLMDQYEGELQREMKIAPLDRLQNGPGGGAGAVLPSSSARSSTLQGASGSLRVVLEAAPDHPRPGQPVQLIAKVTAASKTAITEARFEISGPGIRDRAKLAAVSEQPGVFEGGFTFFEAGRYEVAFSCREGASKVSATRVIVAGDATPAPGVVQTPALPPPPPPAPTATAAPDPAPVHAVPAPAPAPTASGKWL